MPKAPMLAVFGLTAGAAALLAADSGKMSNSRAGPKRLLLHTRLGPDLLVCVYDTVIVWNRAAIRWMRRRAHRERIPSLSGRRRKVIVEIESIELLAAGPRQSSF